MNATEQRAHTTVTTDLVQRIVRVEGAAVAVADMAHKHTRAIRLVNDRVALVSEREQRADERNRATLHVFYDFMARGFWGRLRWLVTGR